MNLFISLILCCNPSLLALSSEEQASWSKTTVSTPPDILEIYADGTEILERDEFHIASHEVVRFIQRKKNHPIAIHVSSDSASVILGRLQSNCPIYLINPNGVFIGNCAAVDTESFIASTAILPDNGLDSPCGQKLGMGSIVNAGSIQATDGNIELIARSIDNQGKMATPNGLVKLIAYAEDFGPQTPSEGIRNVGSIQASSIEMQTDSPGEQAILVNGILITANGGGCLIDGDLISYGGSIEIDAQTVHLGERAELDVSSKAKSGQIRILKSSSLAVERGARLLANATELGDGGNISLAASQQFSFYGQAQACGGDLGGNGGTIHFSSQGGALQFDPSTAPAQAFGKNGRPGTVIFDPKFILISSEGMDPATGNTFDANPSSTASISPSVLQSTLDSANLVIQANTDIIFSSDVTSSSSHSLTLQAGRSIQCFSNVSLNGGDFLATINDSGALADDRDPGVASFQLNDGTRLLTQGGNIAIDVGTFGGVQEGEISFTRSLLDAGGGNIAITGVGRLDGSDEAFGIILGAKSTIQTSGAGTLALHGTGGNGTNYNGGIYLDQGSLTTESGLLQITGYGGGNGTGIICGGIFSSANVQSTDTGSIVFQGFAGTGVHRNVGVWLYGGQVQAAHGDITLDGTGDGTGDMNDGVRLGSGAQCTISEEGNITLTGTAVNGINNNNGATLTNGTLTTNTGGISITGNSNGSLNTNYGIRLQNNSCCTVAGTAGISLIGQNNGGMTQNTGVSISTSGIAITSGYGDIQITGTSGGTESLNQGVSVESGRIVSTGTGAGAAIIHLTGTGSYGIDYCNGVAVVGSATYLTSIDGNIILEGTAHGSGEGNTPLAIDPASHVQCTGSGMVMYIEH